MINAVTGNTSAALAFREPPVGVRRQQRIDFSPPSSPLKRHALVGRDGSSRYRGKRSRGFLPMLMSGRVNVNGNGTAEVDFRFLGAMGSLEMKVFFICIIRMITIVYQNITLKG